MFASIFIEFQASNIIYAIYFIITHYNMYRAIWKNKVPLYILYIESYIFFERDLVGENNEFF